MTGLVQEEMNVEGIYIDSYSGLIGIISQVDINTGVCGNIANDIWNEK